MTVTDPTTIAPPEIRRVMHELKRRDLTVVDVGRVTPHMIRITLQDESLRDFPSLSPDDHIKIFVPQGDGDMARRDYTPRVFDRAAGTLVLDFVDHDGGPAADWARSAKPGDHLAIGGPKGSRVITGDIRNWLLIGDETALPAIGRRVEELDAGTPVTTLAAVTDASEEQSFKTKASYTPVWVHRPSEQAHEAEPFLRALKTIQIAPQTFIWVAAEASVARSIRSVLENERGISPQWIKASGYWTKG
ncbi:siderophore-interacting protein [Gluconobacter sp. P5E10]|uniref:siderophore-interacting protein n=1 Tax=Gluconobacter sp. P5E10 TaxID=2762613 RepID=UPI001C05006B|nr:siderophore-interacting protein [Gluconobacter sp. P5E10]